MKIWWASKLFEASRTSHFWTSQSASCLAAITIFGVPALAEPTDGEFDPWQGIEKNGRIPKIDMPDDLTNPERWRYIPEGRLKPGNIFQRLLVSSASASHSLQTRAPSRTTGRTCSARVFGRALVWVSESPWNAMHPSASMWGSPVKASK